jgi:hypothetical protein
MDFQEVMEEGFWEVIVGRPAVVTGSWEETAEVAAVVEGLRVGVEEGVAGADDGKARAHGG